MQKAWRRFWLAFRERDLKALHRINRPLGRRYRSNIGSAFRQSIPAERVDGSVHGLIALIGGYSGSFQMNPDNTDFEAARRVCAAYARNQLEAGQPSPGG